MTSDSTAWSGASEPQNFVVQFEVGRIHQRSQQLVPLPHIMVYNSRHVLAKDASSGQIRTRTWWHGVTTPQGHGVLLLSTSLYFKSSLASCRNYVGSDLMAWLEWSCHCCAEHRRLVSKDAWSVRGGSRHSDDALILVSWYLQSNETIKYKALLRIKKCTSQCRENITGLLYPHFNKGVYWIRLVRLSVPLWNWTNQLYKEFRLAVRLSICLSHPPFSLCSHHRITNFSGLIIIDRSDVHAKGQGQRSRSQRTKLHLTVSGLYLQFVNTLWLWNDAQS